MRASLVERASGVEMHGSIQAMFVIVSA